MLTEFQEKVAWFLVFILNTLSLIHPYSRTMKTTYTARYRHTILLPSLCAASFVLAGCSWTITGSGPMKTEEYSPSPFTALSQEISARVVLEEGEAHAVRIHSYENLFEHIEVLVDGDRLRIRSDRNLRADPAIEVTVIAPRIESVSVVGSARIGGTAALRGETVAARISGSGRIELPVQATEADIAISGSGRIHLNGAADSVRARISGSGSIRTDEIEARDAVADISGSGRIEVYASQSLRARISGSGRITYGGGAVPDVAVSGTGAVRPADREAVE